MSDSERNAEFGSCCAELKEVLQAEEFDPLIAVGEDGVLYFSVGLMEMDDGEANMIDHPVFFCPFCGTNVQTLEDVEAKSKARSESEEEDATGKQS
jgi:hypothetical protein